MGPLADVGADHVLEDLADSKQQRRRHEIYYSECEQKTCVDLQG